MGCLREDAGGSGGEEKAKSFIRENVYLRISPHSANWREGTGRHAEEGDKVHNSRNPCQTRGRKSSEGSGNPVFGKRKSRSKEPRRQ